MGFNEYLVKQIKEDFANSQARELNRLYCEARHRQSFAEYIGDREQAAEDVSFYADCYDQHIKTCRALNVEVTVKLDYENWSPSHA